MDQDLPEISNVSYAASNMIYSGDNLTAYGLTKADAFRRLTFSDTFPPAQAGPPKESEVVIMAQAMGQGQIKWSKRLVIIAIVDGDKDVPTDKSILLLKGPFMTDMDDQELFMTSEPHKLLELHNDVRAKISVKDKDGKHNPLESIRLRDLKMTVVELAVF